MNKLHGTFYFLVIVTFFLSRSVIVIITKASSILDDHNPGSFDDVERFVFLNNKYESILPSTTLTSSSSTATIRTSLIPTTNSISILGLEFQPSVFTKWDSVYYLNLMHQGNYQKEKELVFYPLFPFLVGFISKYILPVLYSDSDINMILVALVFNNLCFLITSIVLYWYLLGIYVDNRNFIDVSETKVTDDTSHNTSKKDNYNQIEAMMKRNHHRQFRQEFFIQIAIVCFCFNPASVFFSVSIYTESLFSLLTICGMYLLTHSDKYSKGTGTVNSNSDNSQNDSRKVDAFFYDSRFDWYYSYQLAAIHKFYQITLLLSTTAVFFLASCTRSTGSFTIVYVIVYKITTLLQSQSKPYHDSIGNSEVSNQSNIMNDSECLECNSKNTTYTPSQSKYSLVIQTVCEIVALSIAIIIPNIYWNSYSNHKLQQFDILASIYNDITKTVNSNNLIFGDSSTIDTFNHSDYYHSTCSILTLSMTNNNRYYFSFPFNTTYAYLQRKYWNVGFMTQFHWRQIPNFILAAPVIVLSVYTIVVYTRRILHQVRLPDIISEHNFFNLFVDISGISNDHVSTSNNTSNTNTNNDRNSDITTSVNTRSHVRSDNNEKETIVIPLQISLVTAIIAGVVHVTVILFICIFFAHVQITTRVIFSSCPIIYVSCAEILMNKKSKILRRLLIGYFVLYFIAGIVLHTNFYPWT